MLRAGAALLVIFLVLAGCTAPRPSETAASEPPKPKPTRESRGGGGPGTGSFPSQPAQAARDYNFTPLTTFRIDYPAQPGAPANKHSIDLGGNYSHIRITAERWGGALSYVNSNWVLVDRMGVRAAWANNSQLMHHQYSLVCCWGPATTQQYIDRAWTIQPVSSSPEKAQFQTLGWGVDMSLLIIIDIADPIDQGGNETQEQEF